ncbi:MAG: hypothetical protein K2G80_01295, partial [Bacteroidales bacterium]|nr:hypothetical protein [Bacteroidales bacterium]
MKNLLTKIWMPVLLVSLAALQSFGTGTQRFAGHASPADSLALSITDDSLQHTGQADSVFRQEIIISARDTVSVPDSLRETDPFKYKYYIALRDSVTRFRMRDSLMQAGDSLELHRLDSLYLKDSTDTALAEFAAWYSSLSKRERKKYDYEQALPAKIAAINKKMQAKDSIR